MTETDPTSPEVPAPSWFVGRRIEAVQQTGWTISAPYLDGLGAPRYCEIVLRVDGSRHQHLPDRLVPWQGGAQLMPLDVAGHGIAPSLAASVQGRCIRAVVRDVEGDIRLELEAGLFLRVEIDHGTRLIVEHGEGSQVGC